MSLGSQLFCIVFGHLWHGLASTETCLLDAVPPAQRVNLAKGPLGDTVPVPLLVHELLWPSASIVNQIFHIIVTEVLGVNATITEGGDTSISSMYALAGCTRPNDAADRGCPSALAEHPDPGVSLEVWFASGHLAPIRATVENFDVDFLGSVGYDGTERLGGVGSVQAQAYQSIGLPLEYYRAYNVSWHRPWEFFPNTSAVSASRLKPCNQTNFMDSVSAKAHAEFTGDADGTMENAEGDLIYRCWEGVWWRAPACRYSPETCIPMVTGGPGWSVDSSASWAAAYSMPLAIGVALTSADYESIPAETHSMLYTFEPDPTFVDLEPFGVVLPPNDPVAWQVLDKTTGPPMFQLEKVVSLGLASQSPVVYQFTQNFRVTDKAIQKMMLQWKRGVPDNTTRDVACSWVKDNELIWREWVPDATACVPRMGMVNGTLHPVLDRSQASSCEWCAAGRYSERFEDSNGPTHICRLCPAGQGQNLPGQLACEDCSSGTFAEANGTVHCNKCLRGSFALQPGRQRCESCAPGSVAAREGATQCANCTPGTVQRLPGRTACDRCPAGGFQPSAGAESCRNCSDVLLGSSGPIGAIEASECRCPALFFKLPRAGQVDLCEDCSAHEGLDCPGGNEEPLQVEGYWVQIVDTAQREYSVFRCRSPSQCPSGALGTCARGRHGKACNSCKAGHYPVTEGFCEECKGHSVFAMLCMITIGPVSVFAILAVLRVDATTQQITTLTIVATAGQLFTALQALGALHQLQVSLVDPAKFLLSLAGLLAFDLNFLRIPCFFQRDDPISQFMLKLLLLPLIAGLLGVAWLGGRLVKRPIAVEAVYNAMGLFNTVFFISITLAVLLPLQCRRNPNGRLSMLTEPGIECFNSETHWILVTLAIFGVLAFPVAILAWALRATLLYPSLLRTEKGLQMLKSQRFFFSRFKTDRHNFAMTLFIRNTLVPLIPVVLVSTPAIQCSVMGLVLLVVFGLEAVLWPWRTHASNVSALLLDGLLIMAVVSVGPTIDATSGVSQRAISWYVAFCAVSMLVAALCFFAFSLYKRLRRMRRYGAFLCHHKAGAGALARQTKMLMQIRSPSVVFLDSDELDELDRLFDVVRSDTWNLVVLLTSDVLSRVWCAGEIATAHRNGIRMVAMSFDGFALPTKSEIDTITLGWGSDERNTLLSHDITLDMVAEAYQHLATVPQVRGSRSAGVASKGIAVQELVSSCLLPTRRFAAGARDLKDVQESEASILILGAVGNLEVLASCEILQMMLQETLQKAVRVVRGKERTERTEQAQSGSCTTLVVVLTAGLLENPAFAETLLSYQATEGLLQMVSVLADNYFQFPTPDFYAKLQDVGLPSLGKKVGPRLVEMYSELFSAIALPFSPLASEVVLKLEVSELCRRRFRDSSRVLTKGHTHEEELDRPNKPWRLRSWSTCGEAGHRRESLSSVGSSVLSSVDKNILAGMVLQEMQDEVPEFSI